MTYRMSAGAAKSALLLCGTAIILTLGTAPAGLDGLGSTAAFASSHGGDGDGGNGGGSGGSGGGGSDRGSDSGQRGSGEQGARGSGDATADADEARPAEAGQGGGSDRGGGASADSGRPEDKGGRPEGVGGGDEDSDRPDWAGTPGGSAGRGGPPDAGGGGDLYGDLYVILRDAQGVPILSEDGFVQPIDAEGNLIPLDEEGHVLDESLVQEVEFGRLSVSRAPDDVLEGRSEEVLYVLNNATDLSVDPAGRLVVTVDGETRTIDAPLENLSIYVALMETGSIEGVTNDLGDFNFLVDGIKTIEDMEAAASFLAAATDKTGEFTTDEIAYLNLILDIDVTDHTDSADVQYSDVDFSSFTYDRVADYDGVTTTILVEQEDGSWLPTEVDVYDFVFAGTPDTATDGTLEAFTQAAEDSRIVINYIHEYEVPVTPEEL